MKNKIHNFQNSRKTKTKEHKNSHISKRQRLQYFAEAKPKTKPTKTKQNQMIGGNFSICFKKNVNELNIPHKETKKQLTLSQKQYPLIG